MKRKRREKKGRKNDPPGTIFSSHIIADLLSLLLVIAMNGGTVVDKIGKEKITVPQLQVLPSPTRHQEMEEEIACGMILKKSH